ncbi:Glucose import ATP-binding protein GlcV [Candidatus Lokiarchaeum ossiferum]|uniref:Glucose import ATP-binding protein GlcV n=1 Tax=Candidatus Lokiarchaeum ossiferum TaxID=2951803 RepID=A0ABY6HMC5_9ARCH|nr:Glucose import ATP-binding protein GlcV [Candidatus Lokiarchaeum sp. B-35]
MTNRTQTPYSKEITNTSQIEIKNLTFSFIPGQVILKNLSLSIQKGESVVVMGANGSGKSTLLLCILNLLARFEGQILVENMEVNSKNQRYIRRKVGIMFQNPNDQLFLPTVHQELEFGLVNLGYNEKQVKNRIEETITELKLENLMEKKTFHLSYGEKKKIAFASIYAMDPDIFLLDEPFANLDPKSKSDLISILHQLNKRNKTIICISHEIDHIPLFFSKTIVLNQGETLFEGSRRDLYAQPQILQQANLEIPIVSKLYYQLVENLKLTPQEKVPLKEEELIAFIANNVKKVQ